MLPLITGLSNRGYIEKNYLARGRLVELELGAAGLEIGMDVDDVVRLTRDLTYANGRVIPGGTCGTIRLKAAEGLVVEFYTDEPTAAVSALVSAEDLEFLWSDPDNPLIRPWAKFQPWLPRFHNRIAAHKSKKEP